MNMLYYIIIAFAALVMMSVLYWNIFYAVMLRSIRFRLFAYRDELRMLAIEGKVSVKSEVYRDAEVFLCKVISLFPYISMFEFIRYYVATERRGNSSNAPFNEAPAEIKDLVMKASGEALRIMAFNSPFFLTLGVVYSILQVFGAANIENKLVKLTKRFTQSLPAPLDGGWAGLPA